MLTILHGCYKKGECGEREIGRERERRRRRRRRRRKRLVDKLPKEGDKQR